jgi:uncharacterized protein YkwD
MTLDETTFHPLVVRCRIVTSRRLYRRPVLPVLVALFVGATTAGTATVLAKPTDATSTEAAELATSFTYARKPLASERPPAARPPAPAATTTTAVPTTTSAPDTTSSPPPTSTTTSAAPAPAPPASAPAPPPAGQLDRVVVLVNQARVDNGCATLRVDDKLTAAASAHSADMSSRDYFSHTTPEGVTFDKRIENAGFEQPGAENIAKGQQSADEVMAAWMKSKGHRANILNCQLTAIGVGLATDGWYWTQDFGY